MMVQHELHEYLKSSEYIDYEHPDIQVLIRSLSEQAQTDIERARIAFEYVRDQIDHSYDIRHHEVTRKASEVLKSRHGICYAKSHLLAALLRGMNIPAGLSYQRLTLFDEPEDGFCIHALNTVYIRELERWIRVDARGNKEGVDAQFSLDEEKLAFAVRPEIGERNYMTNYAEPHEAIIGTLEKHTDSYMMYHQLPNELSE